MRTIEQPRDRYPSMTGRLRERIRVRRLSDAPDGGGGWTRGWATVADSLPAEVLGQSGREAVIANTLQGTATYKITVRHRTDLRANDQIIWLTGDDMELNILAPPVDPWGTRQETQIFADTSAPQEAGEG